MKFKTQTTLAALSIVSILILVSYQNCGMQVGQLDSPAAKGKTSGTFPYEIEVNNISHMSCITSCNISIT